MTRQKRSKKQLLKIITQYGIHIWAILIIANAVMIYTYHFATHAAGKNDIGTQALTLSGTPSPSGQVSSGPSGTQLSPSPEQGPAIYLDFAIPGIGSGGGVMKPNHPKRNVTVYLYAPSVNSMDPNVSPLYTIQGTATFDTNPENPTYTSFINPNFNLGSNIQNGSYQIAFRTDLSFTALIKQTPSDIGGEVFSLSSNNQTIQIPPQTVLMGDSIPSGNNYSFTINDYNAFVNCYGSKDTTSDFCKGKDYGDFNDDGVVDGIDYNILLRSLNVFAQEGQILPEISPTVSGHKHITTPTHLVKPTIANKTINSNASTKNIRSQKKSGAGLILFILLIIFGALGLLLYLKNEKVHAMINAIIHISPTGSPSEEQETTEETSTETTDASDQPAIETALPTTTSTSAAGDVIEKDCYIKKKEPDEKGTGLWLLLTDDNGAINAHYAKNDAKDGFAKVKGVMKTEKNKKYMEITEIFSED